jgi:hypothetical protein
MCVIARIDEVECLYLMPTIDEPLFGPLKEEKYQIIVN